MRKSGGGRVFRGANAQVFANALAELLVHGGDTSFTVKLDESVALGSKFEFALDHGLIADERPVQVMREGHVAPGLPVADGLGLLEFAGERGFRTNIEPKGEVRTKSHGIKAG